jgi:hypothetical protein
MTKLHAFALAAFLLTTATPISSQESRAVAGRVVNQRGDAIGGATIEVVGTLWRGVSSADGRFRLALPDGVWALRARRIGHRPALQSVVLAPGVATDSLRFVLAEAPSELQGVVVTGERSVPLVATLTTETVRQVPPLGEPDIFRLLPLLPTVSQPNDLLGRFHLAGGASDEHGVYLDGHPLQAPFHVLSVLGGFNVAALDRADVLIHHLPPAMDGRLSGAINLESRRPSIAPEREAVISLLSASVTATQPSLVSGAYVLASGRLTYMDKVLREYARQTRDAGDDLALPSYRDALVKVGRDWSNGWSAELLGYHTLDYVSGSAGGDGYIAPRWGEDMAGTRVRYQGRDWTLAMRLSTDRAAVRYRQSLANVPSSLGDSVDRVRLTQDWTSASVELSRVARRWRLGGGLATDTRRHTHVWRGSQASDWFNGSAPNQQVYAASQTVSGLFAEGAFVGGPRFTASGGGHISVADGATFVGPRLVLGTQLRDALRLELAVNRRHQFDAIAGEPREGTITQPTFLLSRPRIADMVATSAAWRPTPSPLGRRLGAELVVYARRYRDRTVLSDSSARDATFPAFVRVPGHTVGAALSFDAAFAGGTVIQGSYTAQSARERIGGKSAPAAWDAPHNLTMFAGVPLGRRWTFTTAGQLRSGAAVTPVSARIFVPVGGQGYLPRFVFGERNSARLPAYHRVDAGVRYSWKSWGADWVLSAQALNVFFHRNALEYDWDAYFLCLSSGRCALNEGARRGLPIVPSIGVEARWR